MAAHAREGCPFEEHIERFDIWNALTAEERALLCTHTQYARYMKGAGIHRGEIARVPTLHVLSGSLRVYFLSEEGRELTLYFLRPDEISILSSIHSIAAVGGDICIDANEDAEVFQTDTAVVHRILAANIGVRADAYEAAVTRLSGILWKFQQMLFTSADRRLAKFLIEESARTDRDEVRFTHEETAHYLGTAREVVSRLIREFGQEGLVAASRGRIRILDRAALERRAGG